MSLAKAEAGVTRRAPSKSTGPAASGGASRPRIRSGDTEEVFGDASLPGFAGPHRCPPHRCGAPTSPARGEVTCRDPLNPSHLVSLRLDRRAHSPTINCTEAWSEPRIRSGNTEKATTTQAAAGSRGCPCRSPDGHAPQRPAAWRRLLSSWSCPRRRGWGSGRRRGGCGRG